MKHYLFLVIIFISVSSCLKVKMLGTDTPPHQAQSIIPTTLNLTVTDVATWDIEVKDETGSPIQGFTPTAMANISSYPTSMLNKIIICTSSDNLGISTCTMSAPGFMPETAEIIIDMGNWSHSLIIVYACPTNWEDIDLRWRITNYSNEIGTPEEFELLRCNQIGGHYYIKNEINFSEYLYFPIAINNDVTLQFESSLINLQLIDRSENTELPRLFKGVSSPNEISRLNLYSLSIENLNFETDSPDDFIGVIANNLVDPQITNLSVINSTINLGPNAVSSGTALFQNITATSPGAADLTTINLRNIKLTAEATEEVALLANKITSTTTTDLNIQDNIIVSRKNVFTGLIASHLDGEEDVTNNIITNIDAYYNTILSTDSSELGSIGGLFGRIPVNMKPNIQNLRILGLTIIGDDQKTVGGVIGLVQGNLKIMNGQLSQMVLYGQKVGGVYGVYDSGVYGGPHLSSGDIQKLKIQLDNSDFITAFNSVAGTWSLALPDHLNSKTQSVLSSDVSHLGGLGGLSYFNGHDLQAAEVEIDLTAEAGPGTYAGGILGQLENVFESSGVNFTNFHVTTSFSGVSNTASAFMARVHQGGGTLNIHLSDSIFHSLAETSVGEHFLGSVLFPEVRLHMSFYNIYILSPQISRDCPTVSTGDFRACNNPDSYPNYDVFFLTTPSLLYDPTYSSPAFIDLNYSSIWNPGNGVLPVRLK
jgi:hypothetical protein